MAENIHYLFQIHSFLTVKVRYLIGYSVLFQHIVEPSQIYGTHPLSNDRKAGLRQQANLNILWVRKENSCKHSFH